MSMEQSDMHSCSYYCDRPDCVRQQRDELRDRLDALNGSADVNERERVNGRLHPHVRRVVCAAIRAADGSLLLGIRHYSRDMHEQMHKRVDGGRKFGYRHDEDQGFVDQHGVFMSREEAYRVAEAAGQIAYPEACGQGLNGPKLYSEGLY